MQRANDLLVYRPSIFKALLPAILQPSEAVDRTNEEDDIYALDWEEQGFQASFSQLAASQSARSDPAAFAGNDVKGYLMRQVAAAGARNPGVVSLLGCLLKSRELILSSAHSCEKPPRRRTRLLRASLLPRCKLLALPSNRCTNFYHCMLCYKSCSNPMDALRRP